jgi:azurin
MGHNVVVLQKDADVLEFANSSARHVRNEYIDPEKQNLVIAATRILGPGERQEISFVAPRATGDYPFVCSFPGHTQAGMRGVITVRD